MKRIAELFGLTGISSVTELKAGHTNKTYCVECTEGKFILQSLNRSIFRFPDIVMSNTELIEKAFENVREIAVPHFLSCEGKNYVEANDEIWRAYGFIEGGGEYSAFLHGYAVGCFLRVVNTGNIELSQPMEQLHRFEFKDVPMRNIHGDTKADNVIFGKKLTIIDLDTAMNGYIAADYGDMIRSLTAKGYDAEKVCDATEGFAKGLGGILTEAEAASLYTGIVLIIEELRSRYLKGKKNFPNKTPEQCAKRAAELKEQLQVIKSHENEIINIINEYFK